MNRFKRIWFGSEERIFDVLPANVAANFHSPRSENALLWNTVYRIARPAINLGSLLALRPVWGTRDFFEEPHDHLVPYFWGFNVQGKRLGGLDDALAAVDGPGPGTEVDLFLLGEQHLIAVEAKHMSGFGRCSRYQQGRCPEIHSEQSVDEGCRYWEQDDAMFSKVLHLGDRPNEDVASPPCSRHYQLSRTLLLGQRLARHHDLLFSLWIFAPEKSWRSLEVDWLDLCGRVRDSALWRRMRVLSWEQLQRIPA